MADQCISVVWVNVVSADGRREIMQICHSCQPSVMCLNKTAPLLVTDERSPPSCSAWNVFALCGPIYLHEQIHTRLFPVKTQTQAEILVLFYFPRTLPSSFLSVSFMERITEGTAKQGEKSSYKLPVRQKKKIKLNPSLLIGGF